MFTKFLQFLTQHVYCMECFCSMQGMFQDVPQEQRKFTSLIVPESVNESSISNKASGKAFQGLKTRHRARLGNIEGRKEGRGEKIGI